MNERLTEEVDLEPKPTPADYSKMEKLGHQVRELIKYLYTQNPLANAPRSEENPSLIQRGAVSKVMSDPNQMPFNPAPATILNKNNLTILGDKIMPEIMQQLRESPLSYKFVEDLKQGIIDPSTKTKTPPEWLGLFEASSTPHKINVGILPAGTTSSWKDDDIFASIAETLLHEGMHASEYDKAARDVMKTLIPASKAEPLDPLKSLYSQTSPGIQERLTSKTAGISTDDALEYVMNPDVKISKRRLNVFSEKYRRLPFDMPQDELKNILVQDIYDPDFYTSYDARHAIMAMKADSESKKKLKYIKERKKNYPGKTDREIEDLINARNK